MRSLTGGLALAALLLTGCGGGVQIAKRAVGEAATAVGNDSLTVIELSSNDVGRLASQADVSEDVVREVAPQLDNQSLWNRSVSGVTTVYNRTPGEVRSELVGIACDGLRGEISSREDLYANIAERLQAYSPDQLQAFYNSVVGLWTDLYEATNSVDPQTRAAAVLACYTVEQATG